jgi:hypothetical protein
MEQTTNNTSLPLKLLAAVGLLVVLAGLAWGGVKALSYAPQALRAVANAFVGIQATLFSDEEIILSVQEANNTVDHGKSFALSFEHKDKRDDGSYSFFYECRDGAHFEIIPSIGREEIAFCNTYTNFVNENNKLILTPFSTQERFIEVPVAIIFRKNGSQEVDMVGSLTLGVFNGALSGTTSGTTNGGTIIVGNNGNNTGGTGTGTGTTPGQQTNQTNQFGTTTIPHFSDPNGKVDLKVTILETGIVSRTSGAFTATSTIRNTDRAAVKFEIENVGTKKVSGWRFNAILPTNPRYIYNSDGQPELFPGDKIEFILGFDAITKDTSTGTAQVTINADPTNSFFESNEDNNIRKVVVNFIEN